MSGKYQGTQTEKNLQAAFAGESQARNKYTYYAQVARENGDTHIAEAFEQMAKNEMMHAKFWFELLNGKPTDTRECLTQAAMGEYGEWHDMYPDFAAQARADGLEEIAVMFGCSPAAVTNLMRRAFKQLRIYLMG